ncbi:putative replicase protein [Chimpanzee stool associated circular ssDNA virus]|nr:putative replicase protein [Chimpanzee stool associated circular ssDNA virus]
MHLFTDVVSVDIMTTMQRTHTNAELIRWFKIFRDLDIHKWVIGLEEGKGGYGHWQVRCNVRVEVVNDWTAYLRAVFGWLGPISIWTEECSDKYTYETKEGKYWASWDTMGARQQRFGKMRWNQEGAVQALQRTNDREIVVWYDEQGNMGKSWLCGHLFETGQAYYIPPYMTSIQSMIQTVASLVLQDRDSGYPPRPLIVIDIPRSWKWSTELYTAIEAIKDGLIMDPRYGARPVNIHGIKVIVLTNTKPKLDKLSEDRWVLYDPMDYLMML